jgi:hypothetical protein
MAYKPKTAHQEWIERRIAAVHKVYDAYDVLIEHGHEIPTRHMDLQLSCDFHGPDARPSARYYGANANPHFHCYTCKTHEYGVGLYAKYKSLKFMQALSDLERRFGIKIPKRPDAPDIKEPADKGAEYQSDAWNDVPRVLELMEKKLKRLRYRTALIDYVRFCKVLDTIQWDLTHNENKPTPEMSIALSKLRELMDKSVSPDLS